MRRAVDPSHQRTRGSRIGIWYATVRGTVKRSALQRTRETATRARSLPCSKPADVSRRLASTTDISSAGPEVRSAVAQIGVTHVAADEGITPRAELIRWRIPCVEGSAFCKDENFQSANMVLRAIDKPQASV